MKVNVVLDVDTSGATPLMTDIDKALRDYLNSTRIVYNDLSLGRSLTVTFQVEEIKEHP